MDEQDGSAPGCPDCDRPSHEAEWHIAEGETASGPYSLSQLQERWARGEIASDQYVFREGWRDWLPADEVEELRSSRRGQASRPPVPRSQRDDRSRGRSSDVVGEVFAASATGGRSMGHDPFEADRQEDTAPGRRTREERHESFEDHGPSEAWDLDNMPALKTLLASGRTAASPNRAGQDPGEGSGVIDMASSMRQAERASAVTPPPVSVPVTPVASLLQEMPRWGGVNMRQLLANARRPGLLMSVVLTGLFVFVGSVIAWAASDEPAAQASEVRPNGPAVAQPPAQTPAPPSSAAAPKPAAPPPEQPATTRPVAQAHVELGAVPRQARENTPLPRVAAPFEAIPPDESSAGGQAQFAADGDRDPPRWSRKASAKERAKEARAARARARWAAKHGGKSRRMSAKLAGMGRSGRKAQIAPEEADESPTFAPTRSKKSRQSDASLDELVEGALGGKSHAVSREPDPLLDDAEPSLPATPTREQMLAALGKAKSRVARCEGTGTVTASIHIKGPTGRATKIEIEGVSGSTRICVETAIRKTPFPKFQQEDFAVRAPFKLQES